MKDQVCTEEQMLMLRTLGVSTAFCSACLLTMKYGDGKEETIATEPCVLYGKAAIPVFTIPDMLDRMPSEINGYDLIIYKSRDGWFAGYINYESSKLLYNLGTKCSILRDAVYLIFKELAIMGKLIEK